MSDFIHDCLTGNALLEDIDDYIDIWHEGDSKKELYEYLGMDKHEYTLFVEYPELLALIVTAHKEQINVDNIVKREFESIAARSDDQQKMDRLKKWLKTQGLWE